MAWGGGWGSGRWAGGAIGKEGKGASSRETTWQCDRGKQMLSRHVPWQKESLARRS